MAVNPISQRYPFELKDQPGEVVQAHRYAFQGLVDLNKAIRSLKDQITTVTNTVITSSTSGGSTPPTPFPFGGLGGVNNQIGVTAYTIASTDDGILLMLGDASPIAVTLDSAMVTPFFFFVTNLNAGVATLTPTSGNINSIASFPLPQNTMAVVAFDGTNWWSSEAIGGAGTTGFLPAWTDSKTLSNSHIDDGVTTAATLTASEPFVGNKHNAFGPNSSVDAPYVWWNGAGPFPVVISIDENGTGDLSPSGIAAQIDWSPNVTASAASSGVAVSGSIEVNVDGQATTGLFSTGASFNSQNNSDTVAMDTVVGSLIQAVNSGSGTVTHLFGIQAIAAQPGAGTVSNDAIGTLSGITIDAGHIHTAFAFFADAPFIHGGTVDAYTGLYIAEPDMAGGATVTDFRGLWITTNDTYTGITNTWALYSQGTAKSYFGGPVALDAGRAEAYVAKTANYTIGNLDYQIECTANTFTVTLPSAVTYAKRVFSIKNTGTGVITVDTTSSQTIDGALTQVLAQWQNLAVMSNGANWIAIAPRAYSIVQASSATNAQVNQTIFCNTAGAGFTVTVPLASASLGEPISVKKISTDGNTLTVATSGGDLLDGAATQLIITPYTAITFMSDGVSKWWIV